MGKTREELEAMLVLAALEILRLEECVAQEKLRTQAAMAVDVVELVRKRIALRTWMRGLPR